jgi:hypothetical protein
MVIVAVFGRFLAVWGGISKHYTYPGGGLYILANVYKLRTYDAILGRRWWTATDLRTVPAANLAVRGERGTDPDSAGFARLAAGGHVTIEN